jgi:hypothetical protein
MGSFTLATGFWSIHRRTPTPEQVRLTESVVWIRYLGGPLDRVNHHFREEGSGLPEIIHAQSRGGTGTYAAEHARGNDGSWLYRWRGVDSRLPVPPLRLVETVPSGQSWPRVGELFTYLDPGGPLHGAFRIRAWGRLPDTPRGVWIDLDATDESPAPDD